jgi:hypothetical protein
MQYEGQKQYENKTEKEFNSTIVFIVPIKIQLYKLIKFIKSLKKKK